MAQMPDPFPSLRARIKRIEDRLNQRLASSPFFGTGMHPDGEGGLVVEGLLNVTSGEVKSGDYAPGSAGWHLAADAVPEFNDIILRDLPNSMLANPIAVARLHDDAQGFSVPTGAGAQILSASVAIPDGYSQALVLTQVVSLTALNDTAAGDFLYADVKVSGASSVGWQIGSSNVPAGATGVATQMSSDHRTGLSGGTLTIVGYVSSAFGAWGADASNVANLDASVVFLR